tara:strand:- start:2826 stop:3734 length:909 start_codon:yes stop_codon:yes gene_type:complete
MNSTISISSSARLVELGISVVTGSKLDRKASEKVNADNNSQDNVARVTKNIFAHSDVLPEIVKLAAEARQAHAKLSLPWNDSGQRLIPNAMIQDHMKAMGEYRSKFEAMVGDFQAELPSLREQAKVALGDLYNALDYPILIRDIDYYVARKFRFCLDYPPVPENGGFINGVLDDVKDELNDLHQDGFDRKLKMATQEAWDRMYKCLERLSRQLTDKEDGTPKRLYESLLTEAEAICKNLKAFNLTNDPDMEKARVDLWRVIQNADMKDLRDKEYGDSARADMKEKVDDVKASVDSITSKFNF